MEKCIHHKLLMLTKKINVWVLNAKLSEESKKDITLVNKLPV